ncbi:MAG TPA: D-aminoacyl-tRNA deacylase [Methanoregulaceae archaeon]|nr:D-aminoacyl-tRNA deacylase [Methanoregulaceae archaeon]
MYEGLITLKITLISSKNDIAGRNIHRHIHEYLENGIPGAGANFRSGNHSYSHIEVDGRLIFQDRIDEGSDADLMIFLSRHASVNPVPLLTVHCTGNPGRAELGGTERSVATAAPEWMQAVLINLQKLAPPGFGACYEVTHHGPTDLHIPSFFVEIGSTEYEWRNEEAAAAVAIAVLTARPGPAIPMISFGGNHYARRQTDIAVKTQAAFGHIVHSREVPVIDGEMIRLLAGKSRAVAVHIDRKALQRADTARIEQLIQEGGMIHLGEHDLTGIGRVPWNQYVTVRSMVQSAAPTAVINFHGLNSIKDPVWAELDLELFTAALNANTAEFLEKLKKIPCIHLSTPKTPVLAIFITDHNQKAQLLHDLISLCVSTIVINEDTAVEGDYLFIRKKKMDPRKALELGVPTGPLLGLLMQGKTVDAGGRTVHPGMVQICSERRIHVPGLESYL